MSAVSYKHEIYRKLIHVSSLWMPLAIYFLSNTQAIALFSMLLVLLLTFEYLRFSDNKLGGMIKNIFAPILRSHELVRRFRFTGATYTVLAALLCVIFFDTSVTITALSIMLVSDAASSLVGRKWGRMRFFNKSIEGAAAFVVTAYIIVFILNWLGIIPHLLIAGLVAATVAAAVEFFSSQLRLDDNLAITLAVALTMTLLQ